MNRYLSDFLENHLFFLFRLILGGIIMGQKENISITKYVVSVRRVKRNG